MDERSRTQKHTGGSGAWNGTPSPWYSSLGWQLVCNAMCSSQKVGTSGFSLSCRGVKLIFAGGHISLTVAFKGPNAILRLSKNPWIWEACRSMVMMWSALATESILATSFAETEHNSCAFYLGRHMGNMGSLTAVTLDDDAILQALITIGSSISLPLISPQPLWMM